MFYIIKINGAIEVSEFTKDALFCSIIKNITLAFPGKIKRYVSTMM